MLRVLIVRIGAMGDVLHALPAVAALRRAEPAAEIGWAIDPRWAPLLEADPAPAADGLASMTTAGRHAHTPARPDPERSNPRWADPEQSSSEQLSPPLPTPDRRRSVPEPIPAIAARAAQRASIVIADTHVLGRRAPSLRPIVDRVHLVPTRAWKRAPLSLATARSIAGLRRDLRDPAYVLTVDLQGTVRSSVVGALTGAPLFLGPEHPRERPARYLYRQLLATPSQHVVDQAFDLLASITPQPLDPDLFSPDAHLAGPLASAALQLPRDPAAEVWSDRQIDALGHASGPIVLLAPTAGWGAKMWPAERFGQLARALTDRGCTALVNSTGPLDQVARSVVEASGGTAHALASTLPQLIALLRRASLTVAGDTGPLHLAAALGCPVVALFGPTDPARTGPRGSRARVLRDPRSVTDHSRRRAPEAGLLRLGLDDVLRAALELLDLDWRPDLRPATPPVPFSSPMPQTSQTVPAFQSTRPAAPPPETPPGPRASSVAGALDQGHEQSRHLAGPPA